MMHVQMAKIAKISSDFIAKKFLAAGAPPQTHSNCCLSLYLNVAGILQGPGKMLLGSWKVL